MPSLTPMASTDPGPGLSSGKASPVPKPRAKAVITKQLGKEGGSSSSSKIAPSPPKRPGQFGYTPAEEVPAAKSVPTQDRGVKVSFDPDAGSPQGSEWERVGGPTPHPKKIPSDIIYEDDAEVAAKSSPPPAEAPADAAPVEEPAAPAEAEVAPAPVEAEPAPAAAEPAPAAEAAVAPADAPAPVETPAVETPVAEATTDVAPAQEFDPAQDQAAVPEPAKVGVAGTPKDGAAVAGDSYDEDYEDDFADDTQTSMSKAMDGKEGLDDTFEGSASFDKGA